MLTERLRADIMRLKKQAEKFTTENDRVVAEGISKDLWSNQELSRPQLIIIAVKILLTY